MVYSSLLLHPKTASYIATLSNNPRQSILLTGYKGMGKSTLLEHLAESLGARPEHILRIQPAQGSSIGIEEIRSIRSFLKLKSNSASTKLFVLIHDADTMTLEAQNALLKSLEETPVNCYIFLTASRIGQLLPTILSRVERHDIVKPSNEELIQYIRTINPSVDGPRVMALSAGLPGLAISIAKDESSEFLELIQSAKSFFGATIYDRLLVVDGIAKEKIRAVDFLDACLTICRGTIDANSSNPKLLAVWAAKSKAVMRSFKMSERNVSSKLILVELAVNL